MNIRAYKKKYGDLISQKNTREMVSDNEEDIQHKSFISNDKETMIINDRPLFNSQVDPKKITIMGTADKYIPLKDNV